ncbi:hypothetical protein [Azospirillum doebereinerae]|uniref:Uncharacterized protein n=1 Tax=Azospirillum doebereinerae TaxID=92933 RepID=A0A433IZB4_9PROT|nr:hypothetical protein [Azospirillum doebereinerae]MCG5242981.1 hypothetical protein [Azospirillum doebereinerae]RUQ60436.1 hypothetical protein EJ913_30545 [Azospirillum doebereinerae]
MGARRTGEPVEAAPRPRAAVMWLTSVLATLFVPPAVLSAKVFLILFQESGGPMSSLQIRDMLLGDGRMLLAFMAFFPFVGFAVQRHILWREGRPLFILRKPASKL